MFVDPMSQYDSDVAKVESRSGDVENCDDGLCRTDADQIEAGTEGNYKPDGVYGSLSEAVDFTPEPDATSVLIFSAQRDSLNVP